MQSVPCATAASSCPCQSMGVNEPQSGFTSTEPTVVAPHTPMATRFVRYTLPLAATVAGVAVVGWLALSFRPQIESASSIAQVAPSIQQRAPEPTVVSANGQMNDYLLAHQAFSPSSDLQGLAPYIRTVSNRDPESAR